jgi:hypothetical protein
LRFTHKLHFLNRKFDEEFLNTLLNTTTIPRQNLNRFVHIYPRHVVLVWIVILSCTFVKWLFFGRSSILKIHTYNCCLFILAHSQKMNFNFFPQFIWQPKQIKKYMHMKNIINFQSIIIWCVFERMLWQCVCALIKII